jgi:hypothetical protein
MNEISEGRLNSLLARSPRYKIGRERKAILQKYIDLPFDLNRARAGLGNGSWIEKLQRPVGLKRDATPKILVSEATLGNDVNGNPNRDYFSKLE